MAKPAQVIRRVALVCALAFASGAQAQRLTTAQRDSLLRELNGHRDAWRARHITSYRIQVSVGCFCPWPQTPGILEVREGVVVALRDTTGRSMGKPREPWSAYTVEGLFTAAEQAIRNNDAFQVAYDQRWDYPARARGDMNLRLPDDWFWITASLVEPPLAITGVTVIDVRTGKRVSGQSVIVTGDRISAVGSARSTPVPAGAQVIDGRGKYLIPGLWDMHVHLDSTDLAALLRFGITGARDMSGDLEQVLRWRARIAAGQLSGPRLVVAGPMLRGPRDSTESSPWIIRSAEQGQRAVDSLARRGVDFIKVHEGLSRESYFAIARAAQARRLPFVGHVPAGITPLEASAAGQKSIEHLEFVPDRCLPIFSGQSPEGCTTFAANDTWLDPTIGSFRVFARQQFPVIQAGFKKLVPLLRARHIRFLTGTDLGSSGILPGESLHDELALLVDAGFTPAEVLRAATFAPAEFLGVTDSLGTIARGKIADLVLLEADPLADIRNTQRIALVIRSGRSLPP